MVLLLLINRLKNTRIITKLMEIGFVKIHRSILDWEWYEDTKTVRLFFHLILKANYETKNWQGLEIKRGSFVTSISSLKNETKLTSQNIRTCLKKLEQTNEIIIKTTNAYTMISLCNYDKYQDVKSSSNKRLTNEQQTINKPANKRATND